MAGINEVDEARKKIIQKVDLLNKFVRHVLPERDNDVQIKGFGVRGDYYYVDLFMSEKHEGQVVRY